METNSLFGFSHYFHGKSMEELTQSLLLELESTRLRTQQEIQLRDTQFAQLKDVLNKAIKERDEAQQNYEKLIFDNLLLQQQLQTTPLCDLSSIQDEPIKVFDSQNGFSSSDCEESRVSSPVFDQIPPPEKLPEKGKFLQAVMEAGPLLGTLLLAGPLPQWQHPPPALDSCQIPPPPVAVSVPAPAPGCVVRGDRVGRKRGLCDGYNSSVGTKYQKSYSN